MSKVKCIGIIAEDDSDFESSRILIKRIIDKDNLPFKKAIGNGCGKVRRKALAYANNLKNRGCDLLILIHDLDRNELRILEAEIELRLAGNPFSKHFICIPIEELEAWFLSDPVGIKNALNLKRIPNIKGNPQDVISPKEKLRDYVSSCSEKEKIYINTKHNEVLAASVSIELIKDKCVAFSKLYCFLKDQKY